MKKTLMVVSAVALMAIGGSAQAQIVITYFTQGTSGANPVVQVVSDVTENAGVFTYSYTFAVGTLTAGVFSSANAATLYPKNPVGHFTIGLVLPTSTIFDISLGGVPDANADTVEWTYTSGTYGTAVSFQSDAGPGVGTGSADDHIGWDSSNPGSLGGPLVPSVPEPTTVLAGALMLLPLGVGAFRAIRKDRVA